MANDLSLVACMVSPDLPDDDDDVTEKDIALGFEGFCKIWDTAEGTAIDGLVKETSEMLEGFEDERVRALLKQALDVLQLDWLYGKPNWADTHETDQVNRRFAVWRKMHPRDPSSPKRK